MKKYEIYAIYSASKFLGKIKANSEKEAIETAWKNEKMIDDMYISLCWSCAKEIEIGDVYELEAEEI